MTNAENAAAPNEPATAPMTVAAAQTTVAELVAAWRRRGRPDEPVTALGTTGRPIAEIHLSPPGVTNALLDGRLVQERLFPLEVPSLPGFDFAGRFLPAGPVGGDYWSVKYYAESNIVTCKLADVTGHGIGAAILAAAIKFVSGVLFRHSTSPASVIERTNHSLLRETTPDRMATMVYAWIYPRSGRARIVNAGHTPVFICSADGVLEEIPTTGPLLGLMESRYGEVERTLKPGDILFFCSDGISEAGVPGPLFGEARIRDTVRAHRAESADAVADAVMAAALEWCGSSGGGGAPTDDMSLVVVKAVAVDTAAGPPRSKTD
jgi:sigma-B regulation protein RsbU (phosphoserine phosphatase)